MCVEAAFPRVWLLLRGTISFSPFPCFLLRHPGTCFVLLLFPSLRVLASPLTPLRSLAAYCASSKPPPLLSTPLHSPPLHSIQLHSTPLHATPLHSTPVHFTLLPSSVPCLQFHLSNPSQSCGAVLRWREECGSCSYSCLHPSIHPSTHPSIH